MEYKDSRSEELETEVLGEDIAEEEVGPLKKKEDTQDDREEWGELQTLELEEEAFLMQGCSDILNFLNLLSIFAGFELFFSSFLSLLVQMFKLDFSKTDKSFFFVLEFKVSYQLLTWKLFFFFNLLEES